ncbi:MAG: hypothetical protein OXG11_08140 [Chloroflexi bacterium]|nr:hypothetical protein [Chloroflexota bacterium]
MVGLKWGLAGAGPELDIEMHKLGISGLRRLAVVAALAAGVALALAAMPGCGSDCPTPEQQIYLNAGEEWADRSEAGYKDLEAILGELETRPEALIDEEWRRRLKRILDELNRGHEEMMNVEVPAGTQETHRVLVRALETFIEAHELFWGGVLDVDAELIGKAIPKIEEGTRLMEEAIQVVERFCE